MRITSCVKKTICLCGACVSLTLSMTRENFRFLLIRPVQSWRFWIDGKYHRIRKKTSLYRILLNTAAESTKGNFLFEDSHCEVVDRCLSHGMKRDSVSAFRSCHCRQFATNCSVIVKSGLAEWGRETGKDEVWDTAALHCINSPDTCPLTSIVVMLPSSDICWSIRMSSQNSYRTLWRYWKIYVQYIWTVTVHYWDTCIYNV